MTTLLMISRGVLLVSVIFYLYFFFKRKQHDVVVKMWISILIGLFSGVAGKLIEVNLGYSNWSSIQFSIYVSIALFSYCLWKLFIELKTRRQ